MAVSQTDLNNAIQAVIAKEILNNLDSTHREAILQHTLEKVLGSYTFESAIRDVIQEKAIEAAAILAETQHWKTQIHDAVTKGFQKYLSKLQPLIETTLVQAFHGKKSDNHYSNEPSSIATKWPKSE